MLRLPSLPLELSPGSRVRLVIESIDLLGPELTCRYLETLGGEEQSLDSEEEVS